MIQRTKGAQSIVFAEAPYIMSGASVVGKKESEGPLGELFDTFDETNLFGEETWELAEGVMQREACVRALHKANVTAASGDCYIDGSRKFADSVVWIVRSLFYIR